MGLENTPHTMQPATEKRVPAPLYRLLGLYWPYWGWLALVAVLNLLSAGAGLGYPMLARWLINAAVNTRQMATVYHISLFFFVFLVAQAVINLVRTYIMTRCGLLVVAELKRQMYAQLTLLDAHFFNEERSGDIASRIISDVEVAGTKIMGNLLDLVRLSVVIVGGVGVLVYTSPLLAGAMVLTLAVIVLAGRLYGPWVRRLSRVAQERLGQVNVQFMETASAMRFVQSFNRERYEDERYRHLLAGSVDSALERERASLLTNTISSLLARCNFLLVLWLGASLVVGGVVTVGGLVALLMYTLVVADAVGSVTNLINGNLQAIGCTERVYEVLDARPAVADAPDARPLPSVRGQFELRDVHFVYPSAPEHEVVRGLDLSVGPGQVIAIVGPSGAGKSTIAALLCRFYDPVSGSVLLDGHDLRALRLADVRAAIGLVPQEAVIFSGTVRDNIMYGRESATEDDMIAAARTVEAHDFISALPRGYDTDLGERGVKLSGGQRQRIALARTLLKNPPVLIFDEATNSLDNTTEEHVTSAIEALMHGRTTFVIAHRLSTVRHADIIVVLDEGTIVESGTHAELLARRGKYHQLYEAAQERALDPPKLGAAV